MTFGTLTGAHIAPLLTAYFQVFKLTGGHIAPLLTAYFHVFTLAGGHITPILTVYFQVFTLTGGHIAPILTACSESGIRVIDTRHEASAAFAADAACRLSGVPGVCVVTAGPGLTNTVTAVKNARSAESAMLVIAGAAPTLLKGRGEIRDDIGARTHDIEFHIVIHNLEGDGKWR